MAINLYYNIFLAICIQNYPVDSLQMMPFLTRIKHDTGRRDFLTV